MIRLDREVGRGSPLEVPREALPPTGRASTTSSSSSGSRSSRRAAGALGVSPGLPGPANDALDLGNGVLLPLRRGLRPRVDLDAGRILVAAGFSDPDCSLLCASMSSPSFRMPTPGSPSSGPSRHVLGQELDLRLFSYRDTTPLAAGQVDDTPYGGGAGMVLRVDVVAAALDAAYGGAAAIASSRSPRRAAS